MNGLRSRVFPGAILAIPCLLLAPAPAQPTKLASTPPVGRNHFNKNIDDATVRAQR